MAKQTFTTGQVLTAAQMTSLQQTAMGGGEATAKTASYVLTAADAGTTVIMNAAGATTITVNTALFAAGDTVNIQNIGAGICTITAGTATVNTAGSLALNQYEGGVLYFRSTSAATFFDYVQTGSVSPLTTKGDLYGFSTLDARIPIGTNNQVLTADSAEALGLKWATPTAPAQNFSLLGTGTTTSGSTVTVSGISGINTIYIVLRQVSTNTAGSFLSLQFNTDSSALYSFAGVQNLYTISGSTTQFASTNTTNGSAISLSSLPTGTADATVSGVIRVDGCNSAGLKTFTYSGGSNSTAASSNNGYQNMRGGAYAGTSTISSVSLLTDTGTFDAGSFLVYGSA